MAQNTVFEALEAHIASVSDAPGQVVRQSIAEDALERLARHGVRFSAEQAGRVLVEAAAAHGVDLPTHAVPGSLLVTLKRQVATAKLNGLVRKPARRSAEARAADGGRIAELRLIYTLDARGQACVGDEILFRETVWQGTHKRARRGGERWIIARVLSESFGEKAQQHTYTLGVLESWGREAIRPGEAILRKARNVFGHGTRRKPWDNESERARILADMIGRREEADQARRQRIRAQVETTRARLDGAVPPDGERG